MNLLHEELRRARERAGLSQQALADLAGIPRNQVVRAERGENITVETLRKIAIHLPLTELTLMDTKGFRIDIIAEPERLFMAAVENVMRQTAALRGAIILAMETRRAMEAARRATPPLPGEDQLPGDVDPVLILRHLEQLANEIEAVGREAKIA
ncbi:MAG TPA: helix-turn-helix transcriptional regulator [Thermoanaerobaculia bacterium]|nr:helix-turn-helix transcriptional regulator [Thermoanaerobaculia bacterium]